MKLNEGFSVEARLCEPHTRHMFLVTHSWEPQTSAPLRRMLRPGDTFVDAGANFGFYSLLASREVGATGHVMSIEPMPETRAWLQRNLTINRADNVEVLPVAVGSEPGSLTLHRFRGENLGTVSAFSAGRDELEAVTVPVVTLDDAIPPELRRGGGMIKMDIEGGELAAFRGAEGLLREWRPLLMFEIHPALDRAAGWEPQELAEYLAQVGQYLLVVPEGAGVRPFDAVRDLPADRVGEVAEVFGYCPDRPDHVERMAPFLD
jgi:FkbM family methyltransferase